MSSVYDIPCSPEPAQSRISHDRYLKRNNQLPSSDDGVRVKRQQIWPATPASSSFHTLKTIKCDSYPADDWTSGLPSGDHSSKQTMDTTMDRLISHPTRGLAEDFNPPHLHVATDTNPQDPQLLEILTGDRFLEMEPKNTSDSATDMIQSLFSRKVDNGISTERENSNEAKQGCTDVDARLAVELPLDKTPDVRVPNDDEYPLEDLLEEDMTLVAEPAYDCTIEGRMPPSSVARAWDHDSRSAVEYDPRLQYSSPRDSNLKGTDVPRRDTGNITGEDTGVGDDLLDEDVDWQAVRDITNNMPKDPSLASSGQHEKSQKLVNNMMQHQHGSASYNIDDSMALMPFPPTIPIETSGLAPLSSNMLLRTCFRIGEMLSQTVRGHKLRQEMVFELFARVTYSNREPMSKRQYFQFIDLHKDTQPYPTGVLTDWRTTSHLDRQSIAFLNTKECPKLCWCLCRPKRDPKAAIGWTYTILSIKETDWEQVRLAKLVLGGGGDGMGNGATMARI